MKELLLSHAYMHISHIIRQRLVPADSVSEFMFYSDDVRFPPITQTGEEDVLWIAKHGRPPPHLIHMQGHACTHKLFYT